MKVVHCAQCRAARHRLYEIRLMLATVEREGHRAILRSIKAVETRAPEVITPEVHKAIASEVKDRKMRIAHLNSAVAKNQEMVKRYAPLPMRAGIEPKKVAA